MKRLALAWSAEAATNVEEIGDYIARDNPAEAARWIAKLRTKARQAQRLPYAGRVVPEFGRDDVREFVVKNYRIVYLVEARRCTVLSVFERHRRLRLDL